MNMINSKLLVEFYCQKSLSSWPLGGLCRYSSAYDAVDYDYANRHLTVYLVWYEIIRKTPKGCWIALCRSSDSQKFILDDARKKYAYPTEKLARESFIARKIWHIRRLKFDLEHAEAALTAMENKDGA